MRRRQGRVSIWLAFASVGLLGAVPALAICHPDAKGTRTLDLRGHVSGYELEQTTVKVAFVDSGGCARIRRWLPLRGPAVQKAGQNGAACQRGASSSLGESVVVRGSLAPVVRSSDGARRAVLRDGTIVEVYRGTTLLRQWTRDSRDLAQAIALSGDRLVVLVPESAQPDRPSRLEVYSTRSGTLLHTWPLPARLATLDLWGGIALFRLAGGGGLYAVRLSDGRTTFLSPVQPGDTPQIGRNGVVFQSNLYERFNRQGRVFMKFLPTAVVRSDFSRTFDSLATRWPIRAFSMDGPRVAVLLDAPGRACDQVRQWNIPWHNFVRINMQEDLTCATGMNIRALAVGGIGVLWVATKGGTAKVIVSDSKTCMERVAGALRTARTPLAGDGFLLAYGASEGSTSGGGAVDLVNWKTGERVVVPSGSPARALSADGARVAVLRADGRVDLVASSGRLIRTLAPTAPRAIALRRGELVVLTRTGTVEVWSLTTGLREHSWRVPPAARSIDAHFGIAVFSAGQTVYALRLDTGHVVALAHVPRVARVQIEDPGVVYQYNARGRGLMRFIPLAAVEHALE